MLGKNVHRSFILTACLIVYGSLNGEISVVSRAYADLDIQDHSWDAYPWIEGSHLFTHIKGQLKTIEHRYPPPEGASRIQVKTKSFGNWLRQLPMTPINTPVVFFDGSRKPDQSGVAGVIAIDIGKRDLQQCADFTIRLRAEYLHFQKKFSQLSFQYTSGHQIPYSRWMKGERPRVIEKRINNKRRYQIQWRQTQKKGSPNAKLLRSYLTNIFRYAGTASLSRELKSVKSKDIQIGDVYIQGGFPGHAVIVVDLAEHPQHGTLALLAQSYMPAQSPHILQNLNDRDLSPWYKIPSKGEIYTPDWTFKAHALYRFK